MKKLLSSIIMLVVVFALAVSYSSYVFAADEADDVTVVTPETINNTINTVNTVNTTNTVNDTNNVAAPNVTVPTNNTSSYNNTTLPKAGLESNVAIFAVIGVCAVSAIYAYKKVSDYNRI